MPYYFNRKQYNLFWVFGQWFNNPLASTCLLTSSPICATGQYTCGSKWIIESLTKYPIINDTAFSRNKMGKNFKNQILADSFELNLKMWKTSRCHFYYWSWSHKAFPRHYGPYPILNSTRAVDLSKMEIQYTIGRNEALVFTDQKRSIDGIQHFVNLSIISHLFDRSTSNTMNMKSPFMSFKSSDLCTKTLYSVLTIDAQIQQTLCCLCHEFQMWFNMTGEVLRQAALLNNHLKTALILRIL